MRSARFEGWPLRALLAVFPVSFRHEYEEEMREVYAQRLREAQGLGRLAGARLRARVHLDLVRAGLLARAASWSHRRPRPKKGETMLESILGDLRHGVRVARKNPGFTALAVATLAIGIGANTALFSLARAILLQSLPVPEAERVVRLFATDGAGTDVFSYPNFEDLRGSSRSFEQLAAQRRVPVVLGPSAGGRELAAELVSEEYFAVFGVAPLLGRVLSPEDFAQAEGPVVVIGNRLWREDLGAAGDVLGSQIELNRRTYTVVGVMPDGFAGSYPAFRTSVWAPVTLHEQIRPYGVPLENRGWGWLTGTGRLAAAVSLEEARAEVATIASRLEEEYPDTNRDVSFTLLEATPLPEDMRRASEGLLGGLALIVGLVLLAVCANVGGVLLSRALERQREISVRSSIGASHWRLVRLLFAEAMVVALAGATLGLFVALVTGRLLVRALAAVDGMQSFAPPLSFGPVTLAFAYGLALVTASLFGLLPALHAARGGGLGGLRSDPSLTGGVRSRSWAALVVAQVAIAMLLLAGSGLLLRSVQRAEAFDPGFRTRGVAVASVNLRAFGYDDDESVAAFLRAAWERLSAIPGVISVTWANFVPLGGGGDRLGLEIPGHSGADGASTIPTPYTAVGPAYFETLDIAVLSGRGFELADFGTGLPRAIVVNRTFADRYFEGREAVGESLGGPGAPRVPIVGVVADSKVYSLGEEPRPFVYFPSGSSSPTFFVAGGGSAEALLDPIRQALADQDAQVLPRLLVTLAELRRSSLFVQRALGTLTGLLAVLAVVLTALGVYGAVSFGVTRRRRELGLRMALGAWPARVVRLVLARAGRLILVGLALGVVGGVLAGRALSGLLFGVAPFDPLTFAVAALAMAAAVAAASYFPARRALLVDPLEALRQE